MSVAAALLLLAQAKAPPAPLVRATPPAVDPATADARCVIVFGYLGSRGTPEQAQSSRLGIMYFVGKLRGRDGRADVAAAVARAGDTARLAGVDPRAEAGRCGAEIASAAAALRTIPPTPAPGPAPKPPRP